MRDVLKIAFVLLLAWGIQAQTLSVARPQRPPRNFSPPPPPPPAQPLKITTTALWGAIQGTAYSFQLQSTGGSGPIQWTLSGGALPTGLTLDTNTGLVSGTPTSTGVFNPTFRATDAFASLATASYIFVSSPSGSSYGNVGDPLADEGGVSDPNATLLTACSGTILTNNKSYRITQNLNAANPGAICLKLSKGVKLNLGGNTVTGRITMNDSAAGVVVFNGTINCNFVDNGGDAGCLWLVGDLAATQPLRVHHLTIQNSAQFARALHIDWPLTAAPSGISIKVSNLTVTVPTQPTADRSYAVSILADNHNVEATNNDITCVASARACLAIMCFGTHDCRMHHNRLTMTENTTDETGRAMLFDGGVQGGEAFNNLVFANNNRGVRIRDSQHIRIHDNTFKNITDQAGLATVHLGDPDGTAVNDLDVLVDNNSFEAAGGNMFFIRGAINATARNNTITCTGAGACTTSLFATIRASTQTELRLENNQGAVLSLPPKQIFVESGAKAFVCNSGQTFGTGTVVQITCPP